MATLRSAGLHPEVIVSGVDETGVTAASPAALAGTLAARKADAVVAGLAGLAPDDTAVVIGCDSVLELDGEAYGKPGSPAEAVRRWHRMRGRTGVLHTGHRVVLLAGAAVTVRDATASTAVWFADLSDGEIEAYVATGEPLQVAGAFTVDGRGGAFVTRIEGDHHNVVGISLPRVRTLLLELGVDWPRLWSTPTDPRA